MHMLNIKLIFLLKFCNEWDSQFHVLLIANTWLHEATIKQAGIEGVYAKRSANIGINELELAAFQSYNNHNS